MPGVNNCVFIGNVGRDPVSRYTPAGKHVCNFSLAVADRRDNATVWVSCACWGLAAEYAERHIRRGRLICVQGSVSLRTWSAYDGTHGASLDMFVRELTLLDRLPDDEPGDCCNSYGASPGEVGEPVE